MLELVLADKQPLNTKKITAPQLKQYNAKYLKLWNKMQTLELEYGRISQIAYRCHRLNQQLKNQLDQNLDSYDGKATTRALKIDIPDADEP